MHIDKLKLFFEEPIIIGDFTITQPTIGNILEYGEKDFFAMLNPFITNPTTYRLLLWDKGIDWNKISDFELFIMLVKALEPESTNILFGDINFQDFEVKVSQTDKAAIYVLYDEKHNLIIDEFIYHQITSYLRTMFNMFPKVEKAKGRATKELIIEEDRMNLTDKQSQDDESESVLLPLVSSCLNHPGFKYKKEELKNVGIYEFMNSVNRIKVYEVSTAMLKGIYGGMVDGSKIDPNEYNFMRNL